MSAVGWFVACGALIAVVSGLPALADAQPAAPGQDELQSAVRRRPPALFSPSRPGDEPARAGNRTAIDRQLSPDGPVASVGYLCGLDKFGQDASQLHGPALAYGRPGTFLGAQLKLPFR